MRRRKQRQNLILLVCIAALFLCMISVVAFVFVLTNYTATQTIETPEAEELPPVKTPSVSSDDLPEKEPVAYPEPDYNFTLEEIYVPLENLSEEYRIAWVSDLHMITEHETGAVSEDSLGTIKERYETFSITEDGVHAEELWPDIVKCLNTTPDKEWSPCTPVKEWFPPLQVRNGPPPLQIRNGPAALQVRKGSLHSR